MRQTASAIIMIVMIGVIGCDDHDSNLPAPAPLPEPPPHRTEVFELQTIARYGWEDLSESIRPLSTVERDVGGGMFSRAIAIDVDRLNNVYVLDADYKKIVIFDPAGRLARVIVGGYGRGPGEFVEPREMAVGDNGEVFVLDVEADRVTEFDSSGNYRRSFEVIEAQPVFIEMLDGNVVLSRSPRKSAPHTLVVFDPSIGERIDSLVLADEQSIDLSWGGASGALGRGSLGSVIYMQGAPGVIHRIDSQGIDSIGRNLYPDSRTVTRRIGTTDVPSAPVATRGIGTLPDGRYVVMYNEKTYVNNPQGHVVLKSSEMFLDVLDESGAYLGSATLSTDDKSWGKLVVAPNGDLLFLVLDGLFMGVDRMRLIEKPAA